MRISPPPKSSLHARGSSLQHDVREDARPSSPHARGSSHGGVRLDRPAVVFPAHAGVIHAGWLAWLTAKYLPKLCATVERLPRLAISMPLGSRPYALPKLPRSADDRDVATSVGPFPCTVGPALDRDLRASSPSNSHDLQVCLRQKVRSGARFGLLKMDRICAWLRTGAVPRDR